jgi:DNA-binding LacI/PurR family transcriptional regulator
VTLEEVAARAGVSRATVSRVVNGDPRVNEVRAAAVQKAIAELGYVPNPAARALVRRRTDSVALVVCESDQALFGHPFWTQVIRGVHDGAADADQQLVLLLWQTGDDAARIERYLAGRHVDGVVLIGLHGDDSMPVRLQRAGVPVVLGGRPFSASSGGTAVPYADCDNRGGARAAVEHLAGTGRQVVGTVTGPTDTTAGLDRLDGWRDAAAARGLAASADLVAEGDWTAASGERAMAELLDQRPDLDGVFVASDTMAVGALRALATAGRRVPDDVGVVGFDGAALAEASDPPLSSVRQPAQEMGQTLVRLLLTTMAGGHPGNVLFPVELEVRTSSAPPEERA